MAKRLQLKRDVNLYDLYADSGFAPGTQVQIQNQSDHQVYFAPASAPPADRHDYFILYPNEREVVEAASLTAWTKGYLSEILVGVPDAPVNSGPANTDELPEGTTNLYHTDARAQAATIDDATTGAVKGWSSQKIAQEIADNTHPDDDVETVTGTAVTGTPRNPVVNLQTAIQTAVTDVLNNFVGSDVETVLAEIAAMVTGMAHTAITGVDLKPTGVPNQYTVEITWTDEDGVTRTTTDASPITFVDNQLTAQLIKAGPNSSLSQPTIQIESTVGSSTILSNEYEIAGAKVLELLNAAPAGTLDPGTYVIDSSAGSFSVELTNVKGQWHFNNPNMSLDANPVTITSTSDSFTDSVGNQVPTDFLMNAAGVSHSFYNLDGSGQFYTDIDRTIGAVSPFVSGGNWDAATNTPDLTVSTNRVNANGSLYIYNIVNAGTYDLGSGSQTFQAGGEIKWFSGSSYRYDPPVASALTYDRVVAVMSLVWENPSNNNGWTVFPFDTANHNPNGSFDTANNKYVVPVDGDYRVDAVISMKNNSSQSDDPQRVGIRKNSTDTMLSLFHDLSDQLGTGGYMSVTLSGLVPGLVAGDELTVELYDADDRMFILREDTFLSIEQLP